MHSSATDHTVSTVCSGSNRQAVLFITITLTRPILLHEFRQHRTATEPAGCNKGIPNNRPCCVSNDPNATDFMAVPGTWWCLGATSTPPQWVGDVASWHRGAGTPAVR
jgi:hypothetical protein